MRDRPALFPSVQPHFRLLAPRRLLVPELDVRDVAFSADEIEHRAHSVRAHSHAERVRSSDMVAVFDDDAVELNGRSGHAELERTVGVVAWQLILS